MRGDRRSLDRQRVWIAGARALESLPSFQIRGGDRGIFDQDAVVGLRTHAGDGQIGAAGPERLGCAIAIAEHDELVVRKMRTLDQTIDDVDFRFRFEIASDRGVFVGNRLGAFLLVGRGVSAGAKDQMASRADRLERGEDVGIVQFVERGIDVRADRLCVGEHAQELDAQSARKKLAQFVSALVDIALQHFRELLLGIRLPGEELGRDNAPVEISAEAGRLPGADGDPRRPRAPLRLWCFLEARRRSDHRNHAIADFLSEADNVVRPDVALDRPDRARLRFARRVFLADETDPGIDEAVLGEPGASGDVTLEREAAAFGDRLACRPGNGRHVAIGADGEGDGAHRGSSGGACRARKPVTEQATL
jgi:hypothetical protein